MDNQVVIQDGQGQHWLRFRQPVDIVSVMSLDQVVPSLQKIDRAVNEQGLYAAGYIGYEASPAFDSAFKVRSPGTAPLLWFGLYRSPEAIELPAVIRHYELGEWQPSVSQEGYSQAIARVKALIAEGRTYQVNYTYRLSSAFRGSPWGLFLDLVESQEARFSAFLDTGRLVICSASPELFFELNGDELLSRPMKGTAERGRTLAEDMELSEWLRGSEKNRAENVMIVDMIRNDMGRVSRVGSVCVPRLFDVERYPTVWQMTSTVRSRTDASFPEIILSLFPCASVTGAPKVSTMGIIADLETKPRGVYAGCIGYFGPGRRAQFNVAIRTAVIDKIQGRVEYGVGGGIVWDSETDEEYLECQTKARILAARRPKFQLLESILWSPGEGYFLLDYHLRRLVESGDYFGFPVDVVEIKERLGAVSRSFPRLSMKVRVIVHRDGRTECEAVAIDYHEPVLLGLAADPISSDDVFLFHKTTNRVIYERALSERSECDDVLLWNERGEITETTTANVVVELKGEIVTPPVECGLLPGTYRESLLSKGIISERIVTLDELELCDTIAVINSVRKWRQATLVSQHAAKQLSRP